MKKKFVAKKLLHSTLPVVLSVSMLGTTVLAEEAIAAPAQEDAYVEVIASDEVLTEGETDEAETVDVAEETAEVESESADETAETEEVTETTEESDDATKEDDAASEESVEASETTEAIEESEEVAEVEESEEATEVGESEEATEVEEVAESAEEVVEETAEDPSAEIGEILDEEAGEQAAYNQSEEKYLFWIEEDGTATIMGYEGTEKELVIPASITYEGQSYKVASIGDNAFKDNKTITGVTFPATCTSIGVWAFENATSLKKIVIPKTIKEIGISAFEGCVALQEADLQNTFVGEQMFFGCVNLTKVTFGSNVKSLGNYAFGNCKKLSNITLPSGLTSIGFSTFYNCNLGTLTIPSTVTACDEYAFYDSGLTNLIYDAPVVMDGMFDNCHSLEQVTFTDKVQKIGKKAFVFTALKELTLGKNVTEVGEGAFQNCHEMKQLYINSKCTKIGKSAFGFSNGLETVVIAHGLQTIPESAFEYCSNLKVVSIPQSVTTIGKRAFADCYFFSKIYIPVTVKSIGKEAFDNTYMLQVTCVKGSAADNTALYPWDAKISYEYTVMAKPTITVKTAAVGRNVTFNCTTPGAVVFYGDSEKITSSSKFVAAGDTINLTSYNGKIYAKAFANGKWSDLATVSVSIAQVKQPTISFANGKVTVSTATENCDIYYTTDGSVPTVENAHKVKGSKVSVAVSGGTMFRAIAGRSGYTPSKEISIKTGSSVSGTLQVPSFAVKGVFGGREVTFNGPKGSKIYYSTSSSMSTGDKCVNAGEKVTFDKFYGTIYARTYMNGKWSNTARLILKIPQVDIPMIKAEGKGVFVFTSNTPDCYFIYTTDFSDPSLTNGKRIKGNRARIYLGNVEHISVIAVRNCFSNSEENNWY